jgi:putative spermidine/putrescine transport system permease protein
MNELGQSWTLKLLVALCLAYLLAPVVLVFPLSFSADTVMVFPPQSWGLRWYAELARNANMADAFRVSLVLATVVTVLSLLIGIPAAYVIVRIKPAGSQLLFNLFTAPLLLPTIVLGLAMLMVFAPWGWLANWKGLIIAHLVVALPYVLRILATSLATLPHDLEEAAATLGASRLGVFFKVTLPLMAPGIVGATALCFLVSFDEVVVSLFLTGPNLKTLPVELFHYADQRPDPMVACVSTLLIVLTMVVVVVIDRSVGLARTFLK